MALFERFGGPEVMALEEPDKARVADRNIRAGRYTAQPNGAQLPKIADLIDEGKVKVVVASTFELRQVAEAQVALQDKHLRGKVVLKIVS